MRSATLRERLIAYPAGLFLSIGGACLLLACTLAILSIIPAPIVWHPFLAPFIIGGTAAILAVPLGLSARALLGSSVTWPIVALWFFGPCLLLPAILFLSYIGAARHDVPSLIAACVSFCAAGVSLWALLVEPYRIEVTHHRIHGAVPARIRIVHLTDIQTDGLTRRERRVPDIVASLKPDLIVITGDFLTNEMAANARGVAAVRFILERLDAPLGVFAVTGDNDGGTTKDYGRLLDGTRVLLLRDERVRAGGITVTGISRTIIPHLFHKEKAVEPALEAALAAPADEFHLLLYHGPEILFMREEKLADLILAGHTHGGQVNAPFVGPLTSGTPYGRGVARGWHERHGARMYVNRGLGMEGDLAPRIRFLCRPEIAVFDIEPA